MGDSQNDPLRVDFDRQIKLEFHGPTLTSDAGLLAYRELDDALGLTSTAASGLHDTRTGQNTQHSLTALLRQSIYSRLGRLRGCQRRRAPLPRSRPSSAVALSLRTRDRPGLSLLCTSWSCSPG